MKGAMLLHFISKRLVYVVTKIETFLEKRKKCIFFLSFPPVSSTSHFQKEGTIYKKGGGTIFRLKHSTSYLLGTKLFPQRKIQTTHASFIKDACIAYKSPMRLFAVRKRQARNAEGFSVIAQIPLQSNLNLRLQAGGASEKNKFYFILFSIRLTLSLTSGFR